MDERAAFERNIDENPLDATNHLVYADWLDENGHPDEAAFRRSMGIWFMSGGGRFVGDNVPHYAKQGHTRPWMFTTGWKDKDGKPNLPKGVESHDIPFREGSAAAEPLDDNNDAIQMRGFHDQFHWPHYRAMESGLRTAFMANRPKRVSRRTYSRRTGRIYR